MPLNTDDLDRTIFISDNLPFLRTLDTESVDLVIIDPPFGKNQTFEGTLRPPLTDAELEHEYDLLSGWGIQNESDAYEIGVEFPDQSGTTASFRDIWSFQYQVTEADWDMLDEVCPPARRLIEATWYTHSESTAAYIAFMTMRMLEIRRLLKPTGSVYLHCDQQANAYLRQMMDAVFGSTNYRNEITWPRSPGRTSGRHWGNIADTILFYTKTDDYIWHDMRVATGNNRPTSVPLDAAGIRHGESGQAWRDYSPTDIGRHWGIPRVGALAKWIEENVIPNYTSIRSPLERLDALDEAGLIQFSRNGRPSIVRPVEADAGTKINSLWDDIKLLSATSTERTGYPTQKPQALARRIIQASSNPGDLVMDCFAGCAYVPVAAELTGRRWVACDMSPRAWTVVRRQFHKQRDLRIVTEGDLNGTSVSPDLGDDRIIRVRGPHDLPERSTSGEQRRSQIARLPLIQFKQKAIETSEHIWNAFVAEWGTSCWYCGMEKRRSRRELQLDHIEPNKRDGTNDDCWNRALACIDCNGDKGDKLSVDETMDSALEAGRIETQALRDEQAERFQLRHQWARDRWEQIRPRQALNA